MNAHKLTTGFVLVSLFSPLIVLAQDFTPEFRECMQDAYDERESALIDARARFYDSVLEASEERRQRLHESWDQNDAGDQRRMERDADRDFRERIRDIDDEWDDAEDDAKDLFRDRRRVCRSLDDDDDDNGGNSSRSRSSSHSSMFGFASSSSVFGFASSRSSQWNWHSSKSSRSNWWRVYPDQ